MRIAGARVGPFAFFELGGAMWGVVQLRGALVARAIP
jgi:hypothetical protein